MSGTHDLLVKCASFPDQNIHVEIENYNSWNRVFRDNYLAVKYHTDYTELFQSYATDEFGEAIVLCKIRTLTLSSELPVNATLYEYLADTSAPLIILVEVRESKFLSEDQAIRLAERIARNGTYYYISFVVLDDSEYGIFDIETLEELIKFDKYIRFAMITRLNSDGIQIEWSR